jgi:hypothetical protein
MVRGMTQPQRVTEAEAVAAALQVYADAVRYGHTPTPNYLTLHTAAMPRETFLALADRTDAMIQIIEPGEGQSFMPYARLQLPFGAGILPTGIDANVHATSMLTDEMRQDIETHNAECVIPEMTGPAGSAHGAPDFRA